MTALLTELSKNVKLLLLTTKHFETKAKQIVIPSFPILRRLAKKILFPVLPQHHDIVHVNTVSEGLFIGNFIKMFLTEHGWPDPRLAEVHERKHHKREQRALLQLYKIVETLYFS